MKKAIIYLGAIVFILIAFALTIQAAGPPPPPPGGGPGGGEIPIGGSAPLGSGLILLLSMGAAYGAKKIYDARKRLEE
jgi:hypothetical protein